MLSIRDRMDALRIERSLRLESLCPPRAIYDEHNNHVSDYYSEGYYSIDCFLNKGGSKKSMGNICRSLHSMSLGLFVINGVDRYDDVFKYMELVCEMSIDNDGLLFPRSLLSDIVNMSVEKVNSGEIGVKEVRRLKKWEWVGAFVLMTKSEKSSFIARNRNASRNKNTRNKIDVVLDDMLEQESFITTRELSTRCNMSEDSVRKYVRERSEEIDSHNMALFSTVNFNEYVREENTLSVLGVLRMAIEYNKVVSKTDLVKSCGISRSTLYRIWNDVRVQRVLNEYNSIVISLHELN
jgi:hypothetical protein